MEFRFERDLKKPVMQWLSAFGAMARHEVRLPWGPCDIVGVKLNPSAKRLPPISLFDRRLLAHLFQCGNGGTTLTAVRRRLGPYVSSEEILRALSGLVKKRYLDAPRRGRYVAARELPPIHKQIIAIELKLSRIKEAIQQARANKAFATQSYVAFPSTVARRIEEGPKLEELKEAGVGLISVSRDDCRIALFPRRKGSPYDPALADTIAQRFCRAPRSN